MNSNLTVHKEQTTTQARKFTKSMSKKYQECVVTTKRKCIKHGNPKAKLHRQQEHMCTYIHNKNGTVVDTSVSQTNSKNMPQKQMHRKEKIHSFLVSRLQTIGIQFS